MTPVEKKIHDRLKQITPSDFKDEHFIADMERFRGRAMNPKGHDRMLELIKKYRKQVPEWLELRDQAVQEEIDSLGT